MFGKYASPAKHSKAADVEVRVISFGGRKWGFSDSSLPRLQKVLSELNPGYLHMFHNRVILSFKDDEIAFNSALVKLESLQKEEVFDRCRLGVATVSGSVDWFKVCQSAIVSEQQQTR
jgi:hypothetical protein